MIDFRERERERVFFMLFGMCFFLQIRNKGMQINLKLIIHSIEKKKIFFVIQQYFIIFLKNLNKINTLFLFHVLTPPTTIAHRIMQKGE